MKFETVLNAFYENAIRDLKSIKDVRSFTLKQNRFMNWLLRHDEKQREEIARLQAQVASMERIMEREAEKTAKAGMPKDENLYIYPYEGVDE